MQRTDNGIARRKECQNQENWAIKGWKVKISFVKVVDKSFKTTFSQIIFLFV